MATEAWREGEVVDRQADGAQTVVKVFHKGIGFVYCCGADGQPHTLKTVL
jgi:hypothetical protein